MSRPEWQTWPLEPWRRYSSEKYRHGVVEGADGGQCWAHEEQHKDRAIACVNALAGVRNPGAVREVIEAARNLVGQKHGQPNASAGGYAAAWHELNRALARLDREPE